MIIWIALAISLVFNLCAFTVAYNSKTDKLTDVSYAGTFIALLLVGLIQSPSSSVYSWLVVGMIALWAVRIGVFLLIRIHKAGRDRRFDEVRDNFIKFLSFWVLQAVTAWMLMLGALVYLQQGVKPVVSFLVAGMIIWFVGLMVETIADWQKFEFNKRQKNKNNWISKGLWKYSRHPNYFGEILVWFGVYIFVVSGLNGSAQYIAMVSPLFITFILLFVSGVPLLEKSADMRWGENKKYQNYKKSTSVIIPFPPKS